MNLTELLDGKQNAYNEAVNGWGVFFDEKVNDNDKIRVTFEGKKAKTGYAYKQLKNYSGIRYTKTTSRWYHLINYRNPLVKLELQEGKNWITLWERSAR